jgi:pyruvate/2-oxoglutarate dehydrogenase complex dihydrolipoamide dehydrogenase (E3) component
MSIDSDVVVVGAGAAGLAAAFAARRKGASVTLVERRRLGGDCTWTGCVPSKSLLEQARRVHGGRRMGLVGSVDFSAVMERVRDTVLKVSEDESRPTLEAMGIRVVEGEAAFTGPRQLEVDGTGLRGRVVVLATGSVALVPDVPGLRALNPLTNDTVFDLRRLPPRLAVMGGGPIGLELGQAFARLGSEVTILQGPDLLAPKEEPEVSDVLAEVLTTEGVRVLTGSYVDRAERAADGSAVLGTRDGLRVAADAVLCATGRRSQTDGLAPERGGVALTDRGFIATDDKLRTTAEGVYAVGDIVGGLLFTHAGYEMGTLAVNNGLGRRARPFDSRAVPWATFTEPEVGRVGMTEAQAFEAHGDAAKVAYLPIAETDRAKTAGETAGFVKLVAGPHGVVRGLAGGQLVGATVVCPTGGDVVHELALAMRTHTITGRIAQTVHAYPSWSLAVREAAIQFFFEYKGRRARPARPAP